MCCWCWPTRHCTQITSRGSSGALNPLTHGSRPAGRALGQAPSKLADITRAGRGELGIASSLKIPLVLPVTRSVSETWTLPSSLCGVPRLKQSHRAAPLSSPTHRRSASYKANPVEITEQHLPAASHTTRRASCNTLGAHDWLAWKGEKNVQTSDDDDVSRRRRCSLASSESVSLGGEIQDCFRMPGPDQAACVGSSGSQS